MSPSSQCPILTPRQRQERLQWATDQRNWCHQQWQNMICDESRYYISTAMGEREYVAEEKNSIQTIVW